MGVEAGVEVGAQAEAQAQAQAEDEPYQYNIFGWAAAMDRARAVHSTRARSQQHRKINSRLAEQQTEKEVRTMSSSN